jgi:hypothetical protein
MIVQVRARYADMSRVDELPGARDDELGFTITELLVALTVFVSLIVGVAATNATGFRVIGHSSARQSAVQIAMRELESARALPFDALGHNGVPTAGAGPDARISSGTFAVPRGVGEPLLSVGATSQLAHTDGATVPGENVPFTIYRYVTTPDATSVGAGLKRVTVTVTWKGSGSDSANQVDLSTLISAGSLSW